jgi:AraC-like DNA-binding protein
MTVPGGYQPLHWHDEVEILYPLNGDFEITLEGKTYQIPRKHLVVIDSCQVHSTCTHDKMAMYICIHVSKKQMQQYIPQIELYQIRCIPGLIAEEQFAEYLEDCRMMERLMRLYVEESPVFHMEADGIVLQLFAHLILEFSVQAAPALSKTDALTRSRIQELITYVEEHFREHMTLSEIAGHLGLGNEYFCRFFRKNMGISFLDYLNEIRLAHIYRDLTETDAPIAAIMEQNGITNQKLFHRTFKERYGCTPSAVRQNSGNAV